MPAPFEHIARRVHGAGHWSGTPRDRLTLDYEERFRRRIVLTCDGGARVLLDLAEARLLNEGDALVAESGALFLVHAKAEALLEICDQDSTHLLRLAWHLGNRHLPTEFAAGRLRIREDPVIAGMLHALGAEATPVTAPFSPERGAYSAHPGHAHQR